MAEVDAQSGTNGNDYIMLINMMTELGYENQYEEKEN